MYFSAMTTDLKRLIREPILLLLMLVPILALAAIKLMVVLGAPLLLEWLKFDLQPYYGYIMATALLVAPCMLSVVAGFMMIDDRDEAMIDLMAVTPMGYSGYIANRLLLPFVLSVIYTIAGYYFLNIYIVHTGLLVYLALLLGIQSLILGLLLFAITDNKVKGLTYAKGLDSLMFTALADLFNLKWLSALSALLPFYWITTLVIKPLSAQNILLSLGIHLAWLGIAILKAKK